MSDLKKTMERAAEILDRSASVINPEGTIVASTNPGLVGEAVPEAARFFHSEQRVLSSDNRTYTKIIVDSSLAYVLSIDGSDNASQTYLSLLAQWILAELEDSAKEEDRKTFLKNILLDNELPGDIPLKSREFKIAYASPRICYLVKLEDEDDASQALQVLLHLFPNRKTDFVLSIDEDVLVLMKDLPRDYEPEIDEIANSIIATLSSECMIRAHVGVGLPGNTLKDMPKSYQEASLSVTVGHIFEPEARVMRYDRLGLGRLIYQLPPTLCHMFLDEVFPEGSYESLDSETLLTIEQFFENNLNGSETSRQLFVHRNTLVYRLDKAQKITGLDLRRFEDAVMFKLASMVRCYLEYQDKESLLLGANKWWKK
ncbi:MAG: helix-turn-helix domain-containing protein [Eubacteriales bacterium]|nr:helix-turn-helix domain-containing protein [Eubacteriales bacterium]